MPKKLLEPFEQSLASLKEIYVPQTDSVILRDAIILRFQYSIEMAWKTSKKVIEDQGLEADSPKNVMRVLAKINLIESAEPWIDFVNARNLIVHTYNQDTAMEVFTKVSRFVELAEALLHKLKSLPS